MKIKAVSSFTAFTDQMNVFNAGDTGELPDAVARQYIEAGLAVAIKGGKAKAEADDGAADQVDQAGATDKADEGDAPA